MNKVTTTRDRLALVGAVFAGHPGTGIGGPEDLAALLRLELGHEDALDRPVEIAGFWQRAVAPRLTYHICASNLAVSAATSLALGLVLGGELVFKLPSGGGGLPDFVALVASLPSELRGRVRLLDAHDCALMARADAVVVFGGEETVAAVRKEVRWDQRFVAYGPKISLGWVLPGTANRECALAAAREIRAFDQCGCLSPQTYLCADASEAGVFGTLLAEALSMVDSLTPAPPDTRAQMTEVRKRAKVRGDRVWEADGDSGWTVVVRREARIEAGPGHGYVEVLPSQAPGILEEWKAKISSVSVSATSCPREVLESLMRVGVARICRMGNLQDPPLLWRHDGQARLAPLVRWIACDPGMGVA